MAQSSMLHGDWGSTSAGGLLGYLRYFFSWHKLLLLTCCAVQVLNIWFTVCLKKWRNARPTTNKTSEGMTNSTKNCSSCSWTRMKNAFHNRRPVTYQLQLMELPASSLHDYHTPECEFRLSSKSDDSDETLNEITWAFDSSPSVYRPHAAGDTNEYMRGRDRLSPTITMPGRCEVKKLTRNKSKTKKKVDGKTAENNRLYQVRKEIKRESIPTPSTSIPTINPHNPKTTKIAPPQSNKKFTRVGLRKTKKKAPPQGTRIPVSINKRQPNQNAQKMHNNVGITSMQTQVTDGQITPQPGESNLVCKKDSWIWFSKETRPSVENFATRQMKFKSSDPRVVKLAEEIKRQEKLNQDIERNARSLIESSSFSSNIRDLQGLNFTVENPSETTLAPTFNDHETRLEIGDDSFTTNISNQILNYNKIIPEMDDGLQRYTASKTNQMRNKTKLTQIGSEFNSNYFKNKNTGDGSVPTKLGSPTRLMKNSLTKPKSSRNVDGKLYSSTSSSNDSHAKQHDGKHIAAPGAYHNKSQVTVNTSSDEPKDHSIIHSVDTSQRRFWPRSMSANITGQFLKGSHQFCNQTIQTNGSNFKLAMNESPSASRPRKSRTQELMSAPVSGADYSMRSSSCILSTGDSENSTHSKFFKQNNPRVESVIKREVQSIVSGLFKSPDNTMSITLSPLVSMSNENGSRCITPSFESYFTDINRKHSQQKQPSKLSVTEHENTQPVFLPPYRKINEDHQKLMSKIPVSSHSPNTATHIPHTGTLNSSPSKTYNYGSSFSSPKKVNIYSPNYYLGKKRSSSCQRESLMSNKTSQFTLSWPVSGDDRHVVQDLDGSQKLGSISNRFLSGSGINFKKKFAKTNTESIVNNFMYKTYNNPNYGQSAHIDNLKTNDENTKQLDVVGVSSTGVSNQFDCLHVKPSIDVVYNKNSYEKTSTCLESLHYQNDKSKYHLVGSNNSSNYPPSKRFIGFRAQNRDRPFRGMPYDVTIHRCKFDKLKVPFQKADTIYSDTDRIYTNESLLSQSNMNYNVWDNFENDMYTDNLINDSLKTTETNTIHNSQTTYTNGFTLNFNKTPVFDIGTQPPDGVGTSINSIPVKETNYEYNHKTCTLHTFQPPLCEDGLFSDNQISEVNCDQTHSHDHQFLDNSHIHQFLDKSGHIPTSNMDSGYDTVSIDVTASQNITPMSAYASVVSNFNTSDSDYLDPSPSHSGSVYPSSPEIAEINLLSSEDNDSTQDTLPPSTSDDNSFWSWDRDTCLPEAKNSPQKLLKSESINECLSRSEQQDKNSEDDSVTHYDVKNNHEASVGTEVTTDAERVDSCCFSRENTYTINEHEKIKSNLNISDQNKAHKITWDVLTKNNPSLDKDEDKFGFSAIALFTNEDARPSHLRVSTAEKSSIRSFDKRKAPQFCSFDSVVPYYRSMSRFNRSQELTSHNRSKKKQQKPIIPKRGVPFSELLKRF